jgi:hypothetical protein
MYKISDITGIYISLKPGEIEQLLIILDTYGSINRSGTYDNPENALFIGITKDNLFEQLLNKLDEPLLNMMGVYDVREKLGTICELKLLFHFSDDSMDGFVFKYGSESSGVPKEITSFIDSAVVLTDPWFQKQKIMVQEAKSRNN